MIATHNSGTGEPSATFLHKLLIPFAKCQSKPIALQYAYGATLFDLRVRYHNGKLYLAHGLWRSSKKLYDVITQLNRMALECDEYVNIIVTYEGTMPESDHKKFATSIRNLLNAYTHVNLCYVAVKKPEWRTLWASKNCPYTTHGFQSLEKFPYSLLPIPWIWNLFVHHPSAPCDSSHVSASSTPQSHPSAPCDMSHVIKASAAQPSSAASAAQSPSSAGATTYTLIDFL